MKFQIIPAPEGFRVRNTEASRDVIPRPVSWCRAFEIKRALEGNGPRREEARRLP